MPLPTPADIARERGVSLQSRGSSHTVRVRNDLYTERTGKKYYFATFDDEGEAIEHGNRVARSLAQGVVPAEILAQAKAAVVVDNPPLQGIVRQYLNGASNLTASDSALLGSVQFLDELAEARLADVTFDWAVAYVRRLKGRAPVALDRAHPCVGALGRSSRLAPSAHDAHRPARLPPNAMRLLPKGYSTRTTP